MPETHRGRRLGPTLAVTLLLGALSAAPAPAQDAEMEARAVGGSDAIRPNDFRSRQSDIDLDKGRLAVGMNLHNEVWIYEQVAGEWEITSKVNTDHTRFVGNRVALDGNWLATASDESESVEVYRLVRGAWVWKQTLDTGHAIREVALETPHLVAAGARTATTFHLDGGNWSHVTDITQDDLDTAGADPRAAFAGSIALDGNTLALAAFRQGGIAVFRFADGAWEPDGIAEIAMPTSADPGVLARDGRIYTFYREDITVFERVPAGWQVEEVLVSERWVASLGVSPELIVTHSFSAEFMEIWLPDGGTWVPIQRYPTRDDWQATDIAIEYPYLAISWDDNRILVWDFVGDCQGLEPTIVGTPGDDRLVGTRGPDVIAGSLGDDVIIGRGGDDVLCGGLGNDALFPGAGDDTVDGGSGADEVSYKKTAGPIDIDLKTGTATGEGNDTIVAVEGVIGSKSGDTIRGTNSRNVLRGKGGDDTIYPGKGNDLVVCGAGDDVVSWENLAKGLTIRLGGGGIRGCGTAVGTEGDDTIIGSRRSETLQGGPGDDLIQPGGGNDTVDGGPGTDMISYENFNGAVLIDMREPKTRARGVDTFENIENARGTSQHDTIIGDVRANRLEGLGGNDILIGMGGDDELIAGPGHDLMWGGPGDDYMRGDEWDAVTYEASKTPVEVRGRFATGEGEDELAGIDIVIGSEFDDRIINKDTSIGLGGDDYIQMGSRGEAQGGAGNDTIVGTNTDRVYETVFYDDAPQRVIVDLGSGSAVGHGTDTLSRIEAVVGSPYDDRITGDGRGNWFWGLEGNDVLSGLGGNDDLDGYLGYDTLIAGPGFDDCIDGESLSGCERTWYRAAEKQPRLPRVVRMYLGVVARYG